MKRFYINCTIRVLLLSGTICLLAYLFFKTDFIAAAIFTGLLAVYQIFALIRYVSKTNRDLTRFLDSIKYSDFSQSFANNLKGSGFEELHTAFTEVIQEFQRTKIEKEEHFRFLQTIVDHVGIALIAYTPAGEVELINNAAKKLLKIPRLGNLKDLEPISARLTAKLRGLSPGENDLFKLQQGDELLQLSIHATGFVLHQQQLMLVALQNIQSELEEKEMKSWQNLIRVLTHEIMNSITPIASLASTAHGLLKDERECEVPETMNETIQMINNFSHKGSGINHIMIFPFVFAPLSPIYLPANRKKHNLSGYMTDWKHDTMDFTQAYKYAKEIFLRCNNVYPFYGIDEFDKVDIVKLKKVAQLRMQIRKAAFMDSPEVVEQGWEKLRQVMIS